MASNPQGKRITSENLAGQVTTTAWDCCLAYGYNEKSELTNAVAAVDSDYRYDYAFDDIGNRITSLDLGTNRTYTANNLNQYTAITDVAAASSPSQDTTFVPQFDDDGNQTLIKTSTGIWSVTYNGENRPILWRCTQSNNQTITNNQTISMSYDRMGRRVTKNAQRFVYDGYLQIANFEHQTSNFKLQTFIWDPTEPLATRQLVFWDNSMQPHYYVHDGCKNVTELVPSLGAYGMSHYEYSAYGEVVRTFGECRFENTFRFSSEYVDDIDTCEEQGNDILKDAVEEFLSLEDDSGRKVEAGLL